jgi:hypothetical protein
MSTQQFQVRKDQLGTTRIVSLPDVPLTDGQVRVRVDRFAFTSNNITYAAFGQAMQYWQFYPVPADPDGTAWGCIPVWGFGTVVQSLHPGVAVAERLYGYWPMASHAVLQPVRLSAGSFSDGAPHRAALHAVYNQVQRVTSDPFYTADSEDGAGPAAAAVPHCLADRRLSGGQRLLRHQRRQPGRRQPRRAAAQLGQQQDGVGHRRPVGEAARSRGGGSHLARQRGLLREPGCYSRVLTYDQLNDLPADTPCVYVDFAGSGPLRQAIHTRFSRLAYSCSIGGTHVEQLAGAKDLPGPKATLAASAKPARGGRRRSTSAVAPAGRLRCAARSCGPACNSLRSLRSLRSGPAESEVEARALRALAASPALLAASHSRHRPPRAGFAPAWLACLELAHHPRCCKVGRGKARSAHVRRRGAQVLRPARAQRAPQPLTRRALNAVSAANEVNCTPGAARPRTAAQSGRRHDRRR